MFANRLLQLHLRRRCRGYGQIAALKSDVLDRIVYNSVLQSKKIVQYWKNVREKSRDQKQIELKSDVEPVTLQYLNEYSEPDKTEEPQVLSESIDRPHVLPYSIVSKIVSNVDGKQIEDYEDQEINYDCKSRI